MNKKSFVAALETHFEGSGAQFKLRYRNRNLYVVMDGGLDEIVAVLEGRSHGQEYLDHVKRKTFDIIALHLGTIELKRRLEGQA